MTQPLSRGLWRLGHGWRLGICFYPETNLSTAAQKCNKTFSGMQSFYDSSIHRRSGVNSNEPRGARIQRRRAFTDGPHSRAVRIHKAARIHRRRAFTGGAHSHAVRILLVYDCCGYYSFCVHAILAHPYYFLLA